MNYVRHPGVAADLWGRDEASSITQPPMYGHAVAELVRRGVDVDQETVAKAEHGLRFPAIRPPPTSQRSGNAVPSMGERCRRQPPLG